MARLHAAEAVELVRRIRHDYLNHFQVIAGYLELGMPEKAQSYINEVNADAMRERELLGMQPPALGLMLYQLYSHWRLQGIILQFAAAETDDEQVLACLGPEIEKLIMSQGWRAPDEGELLLTVELEKAGDRTFRLRVLEPGTQAGGSTIIKRP